MNNTERPQFAIACPGQPCALARTPDSHSHMPLQSPAGPNPNLDSTDPEFLRLRQEIFQAPDGLTEAQREDELLMWELGTLATCRIPNLIARGA